MEENYTEMELDVMERIICTVRRNDVDSNSFFSNDVWRLYSDRAFRKQQINSYWTNVHGVGDSTNE